MIFADKLIALRKKSGWSQEELAEQMNVTRQAISKWEGAQSIPDLEKMLRLSGLFGVSLDYLLKDEIELEETETAIPAGEDATLRRVSLDEANAFLQIKLKTAKSTARAISLCILSPVCLLLLAAFSEQPGARISEEAAAGGGLIVLLILIAAAVAVLIANGGQTAPYEYLDSEPVETEYGVSGLARERQAQYRDTYMRHSILGTCLCIAAVIPLFAGIIVNENNDLLMIVMLCLTLGIVGIGVYFLVSGNIVWESFQKLLQEGDYTREKKKRHTAATAVSSAYWCTATAIYLAVSLTRNNWHESWIIWVVAGILYPAVSAIFHAFCRHHQN